jgi:tryptophanyl-tRNA synthetase
MDQVQHIEVCRDLAGSFNHQFGDVFVLPKAKVLEESAKVPGTDGEKMSKSYENTIDIFEDGKAMRKKIMRIVTDSRPMEDPKDPDTDPLYQLYSLFVGQAQREAMAAKYRAGDSAMARSRKRWPTPRKAISPSSGTAAAGWPLIRKTSPGSWRTVPSGPVARLGRYCSGLNRLAD